MKNFLCSIFVLAVLLCLSAPTAQALMFEDLGWGGWTSGVSSKSFSVSENGLDYDIHFEALGGSLTWGNDDGGVGINDDEITGGREALVIWFSKPLPISYFKLVDLFEEADTEAGYFLYDSSFGSWPLLDGGGAFQASTTQTPGTEGYYSLGIHDQVQGIFFSALEPSSDYAVAGFDTPAPVPEPSTVLLLGIGMIGLAGLGRRKFRQS